MTNLTEKELKVLNEIANNSAISQRELARETGISLGLINVILKKFLQTGYLKVSKLNKRKLEYILTPNGFLAVARKTYQFATYTIRSYRQIHTQLSTLLMSLSESGYNYFSVHGDGELRELIEVIVPMIFKDGAAQLGDEHREHESAIILNITAEPPEAHVKGKVVNVLERIN